MVSSFIFSLFSTDTGTASLCKLTIRIRLTTPTAVFVVLYLWFNYYLLLYLLLSIYKVTVLAIVNFTIVTVLAIVNFIIVTVLAIVKSPIEYTGNPHL